MIQQERISKTSCSRGLYMVGRESKQGNFRLLIKRHIRMAHVASELTLKLRYEEPSGHEKRGAAPLY